MAMINLSEGAIEAICNGNKEIQPLLQVTDIRLVNTQNPNNKSERYRLLLSDGIHIQQGMLATQNNGLVNSGALQKGSIIRILQFICNEIQSRKIIIIINLEVIQETCPQIGVPIHFGPRPNAQVTSTVAQPGNAQHANLQPPVTGSSPRPIAAGGVLQQPKLEDPVQMQSYGNSASNSAAGHYTTNNGSPLHARPEFTAGNSLNAGGGGVGHGPFHNVKTDVLSAPPNAYARQQPPSYQQRPFHQQPSSVYTNRGPVARNEASLRIVPIAALHPYQGRWTIKARVTAKSDLRRYNNARGEGRVFSFDLLDCEGGEIRAICFNDVADQFYGLIEVGKVYLISKGTLKPAQKTFNHLPNDHEIVLDATSLVQPFLEDDCKIPRQQFHFRPISDIENIDNNGIVDVIGVVSSISPSTSIMRKNGTETQKRSLQLKDKSGKSVELTLWGNFCNVEGQTLQAMCDSGNFPVLALKAARVSDFNGKNVGTLSSSQLFIEPDFPEAQKLKEWFDREGKNMYASSISRDTTSLVRTDARKTISQIKDEKLGTSEKPDWITVCATITFIKNDNFCYRACPKMIGDRKCSKKVTDNGDGKWRCERCDESFDECEIEYRYILQFQIQDHTSLTWVTAFQEIGEEIMGISAKNLYYLKNEEQDDGKIRGITCAAGFNRYIFKLKVKEESFNDETRVKSTVVKADRVKFAAESRFLLESMNNFKAGESVGLSGTPILGANRSGIGYVGVSQPLVSGVNYGTSSALSGRETGMHSNNASQFGNQYSGGYAGGAIASGMNMTCSSCGGIGHNSATCPSIINSQGAFGNQPIPAGSNSGQCYKCQKIGHFARDCPGLNAVPPAYGGSDLGSNRYGGGQRQHVGGF